MRMGSKKFQGSSFRTRKTQFQLVFIGKHIKKTP